jgi:hypothetical protein
VQSYFFLKYAQMQGINAVHPGVDALIELHRVIQRHVPHYIVMQPALRSHAGFMQPANMPQYVQAPRLNETAQKHD